MKFYHVSEDIYNDILEFKPRVPKSILKGENDNISRVCVAKEIKNCINSVDYYDSINFLYSSVEDNEVLCGNRLLKVYEFEIDDEDDLLKDFFEISKYVPDAIVNEEYWYMGNLKPLDSYIINIIDCANDNDIIKYNKVRYEIVDIKDIPTEAIVNIQSDDVEELLEYINNSNIRGFLSDNNIVFKLDSFPMTIENYKATFGNMFAAEQIKGICLK